MSPEVLSREEREKIERRVEQLRALARSESTTAGERSAAAYALVGLMDRHDLRVVFPDAAPARREEFASQGAPDEGDSGFDPSTIRVGFKKKRPERRVEVEEVDSPPPTKSQAVRAEDVGSVARRVATARGRGFVRLASRYAGACEHCHQPYRRGDFIYWSRQRGAWHEECFEDEFGDGT